MFYLSITSLLAWVGFGQFWNSSRTVMRSISSEVSKQQPAWDSPACRNEIEICMQSSFRAKWGLWLNGILALIYFLTSDLPLWKAFLSALGLHLVVGLALKLCCLDAYFTRLILKQTSKNRLSHGHEWGLTSFRVGDYCDGIIAYLQDYSK